MTFQPLCYGHERLIEDSEDLTLLHFTEMNSGR